MGSNLTNFYSSESGNTFNDIELPSTVSIINIKNSTWNNLSFWDTTPGVNDEATLTRHQTEVTTGQYVNIPSSVMEVHFLGSTGRTRESLLFIRDWIKSIVATEGEQALSNYTLEMDDVFWSPEVIGNDSDLLTYDELRLIWCICFDIVLRIIFYFLKFLFPPIFDSFFYKTSLCCCKLFHYKLISGKLSF